MAATHVGAKTKTPVIFFNGAKYEAPSDRMTGRGLALMAGIPADNHIFLEVPGPREDRRVLPDDVVDLRPGMRFFDVPIGNLG